MPVTQADIDQLNSALAQGEKIVRLDGKWVEYRSVEQIVKARDDLQRQLDAQNGANRKRVVYHTQSGRGY